MKKEALFLRENFESLVVAFVFALIIKGFFLEVFKIPTSSMSPTLKGDHLEGDAQVSGDKMMAVKTWYWFTDIKRYDVVIFRYPMTISKFFIKRVTGLPNEEFVVWKGNIWTKRDGDNSYMIRRRPIEVQESIWIPFDEYARGELDSEDFKKFWTVENGEAAKSAITFNAAEKDLVVSNADVLTDRDDDRDRFGQLIQQTNWRYLDDLKVSTTFAADSGSGIFEVSIANSIGTFTFAIGSDGAKLSSSTFEGLKEVPLADLKITPRVPMKVELAEYDHTLFLKINGRMHSSLEFLNSMEFPRQVETEMGVETGASWRVHGSNPRVTVKAHGIAGRISDIFLWRDIYYKDVECNNAYCKNDGEHYHIEEGKPVHTGPTEYIVMGDNVPNSRDSRRWSVYTWRLNDGKTIQAEQMAGSENNVTLYWKLKNGLELQVYHPNNPNFIWASEDGSVNRSVKTSGQSFYDPVSGTWEIRFANEKDRNRFHIIAIRDSDIESIEWRVKEDAYGNSFTIDDSKVIELRSDPLMFIDRKFIEGKGLLIWWPPKRWKFIK